MTADRLGAPRVLAWLILILIVPYVLVFGGTLNALAWPEGRVVLQVITVAAGVAGLLLAVRRPNLVRSPVVVTGAIYALVVVVAAAVSQRPAASTEAAALIVIAAPCYLAIRAAAWDTPLERRTSWLMVVVAFLILVPYVIQILAAWIEWWRVVGLSVPPIRPTGVAGTVGSPNVIATFTYLLAPYAAWVAWSWRRGRPLAATLILLASFALVTTGSRGAWLGAAVGLATGVALVALDRRDLLEQISRRRLAAIAVVGGVILVAISPWLVSRFATGDAGRLELWSAAASIFGRWPMLGAGPGSWQGLRPLEPIAWADTASILTPHDSLLYVAAESGIVGLAGAVALVAAVIVVGVRAYRETTSERRIEVAVVAGSLVALAVHSLVDPQFMLAAVVLLTAYLVARLDGPIASAQAANRTVPRLAVAGWAGAMILSVVALVRVDGAMLEAESGRHALDAGDWRTASTSFGHAVELHDLGAYDLGHAIALSREGDTIGAAAALGRQAASDSMTSASAGIATLLESTDAQAATAAADVVGAAGSYDPTATLNAAGLLDRQGDPRAIALIADVLVAVPFLELDPLPAGPVSAETWRAGIETAIDRLRATDPLAAASVALEAGEADLASDLAADAPPGAERELFTGFIGALAGLPPDLVAAREDTLDTPTQRALVWYARLATLAASAPDLDRAVVMHQQLFRGPPTESPRVDVEDDPEAANVLRVVSYPGAFYRIGPARPYVAGTTTIALEPWQP